MQSLILILKGVVVGIANVIPGVSGGTLAVILGIYERLTEAIGNFVQDKANRRRHMAFLLLIALGAGIGVILFAKLFVFLLTSPVLKQNTYFFFTGLILGSIPLIMNMHSDMKASPGRIISLVIAAAMVITVSIAGGASGEAAQKITPTGEIFGIFKVAEISFSYGLWLIACGFLAAGAMVMPGFSGSALLISLGEYNQILYFVDERIIIPVALIALGAVPGVIMFAKVISVALKRSPSVTYYFILGLIIASLFQIVLEMALEFQTDAVVILSNLIIFGAGFIISYWMGRMNKE
ncbi:MAG: DUF368 domain-containing protein [Bacteroidota bacterium]